MTTNPTVEQLPLPKVDLKDILARFWPLNQEKPITADDIAEAISYLFTDQISEVQAGALLVCLHFTGWDRQPDVLFKTAQAMLRFAQPIDANELRTVVDKSRRKEGAYEGGLCDIVGTGGDSHNTFNISTTSSIVASSLLLIAKHGNRASTSKSGAADLLKCMTEPLGPPNLEGVSPETLSRIYASSRYAFLFAPVFHPGMRYVAPVRRQLPWRTLFNVVGPLANPLDATGLPCLEARMLGVARRDIGPAFARALRMLGARKAMVVCGEEELDEVSCAGPTLCWRLKEDSSSSSSSVSGAECSDLDDDPSIEHFRLHPSDFGLPCHPLHTVSSGKEPAENAAILARLLRGELSDDDPILHFVLINTAVLFVIAGVCEADESAMGPGDEGAVIKERGPGGGRWKEGVRRARWAIRSGEAVKQWKRFVDVTNTVGP